jgi:hypothetical protein
MQQSILSALILAAAACLTGARGADFVGDSTPAENSDWIASAIDSCVYDTRNSSFPWFAPSVQSVTRMCSMRVRGLTLLEYRALGMGCLAVDQRKWVFELCAEAVDKKLRPMMVPHKAPEHPVGLTAAELAALEAGCDEVRDASDKELCHSGNRKIRDLILEPPEMQKN